MAEKFRMDPHNKEAWLQALRSGKFEQGKKALCVDDKYCCLGVLAECMGVLEKTEVTYGSGSIQGSWSWLYPQIVPMEIQAHLGKMNDAPDGKNFLEIADYIEENL